MDPVLVVNAGSTSLKLHVVTAAGESSAVESFAAAAGQIGAVAHRVVHGGAHFRNA